MKTHRISLVRARERERESEAACLLLKNAQPRPSRYFLRRRRVASSSIFAQSTAGDRTDLLPQPGVQRAVRRALRAVQATGEWRGRGARRDRPRASPAHRAHRRGIPSHLSNKDPLVRERERETTTTTTTTTALVLSTGARRVRGVCHRFPDGATLSHSPQKTILRACASLYKGAVSLSRERTHDRGASGPR